MENPQIGKKRQREEIENEASKKQSTISENVGQQPVSLSPEPASEQGVEGQLVQEDRKEIRFSKQIWTAEEDQRLIEAVQLHGDRAWSRVARCLPNRIGKQCRDRWCNHLCPHIVKVNWTSDEDQKLVEAHKKFGNQWALIARECLPGRTDLSVKNRYYSNLRKNDRQRQGLSVKDETPPQGQEKSDSTTVSPPASPAQQPQKQQQPSQQQQQPAQPQQRELQLLRQYQLLQQCQQQQEELMLQLERNKQLESMLTMETARLSSEKQNETAKETSAEMPGMFQQQQPGGGFSYPTMAPHGHQQYMNSPAGIINFSQLMGQNNFLPMQQGMANTGNSSPGTVTPPLAGNPSGENSGVKLQRHILASLVNNSLQQMLSQREHDFQQTGLAGMIGSEQNKLQGGYNQDISTNMLPLSYPNGRPISGAIPGTENTGRWTEQEHERFLDGLKRHGTKHWTAIANVVKTRTVVQVRTHAQKYFKKLEQEGKLTKHQEEQLADSQ